MHRTSMKICEYVMCEHLELIRNRYQRQKPNLEILQSILSFVYLFIYFDVRVKSFKRNADNIKIINSD